MSKKHLFGFLTLLLSVVSTAAVAAGTNSLGVLIGVFLVSGPALLGMCIALVEVGMWLEGV